MGTYKDLFTLSPRPEEVITMDEAIVSQKGETIRSYIITSKLHKKFSDIFHQLSINKGRGFWIQGAYGSGKSHFMSYLTVLLNDDKYWQYVPQELSQEYAPKLKGRKFLTVNFTLSEVNNLRVKLFDEIEKALHQKGYKVHIKNDEKIVNQFLNSEYGFLQKDKFFEVIKEKCSVSVQDWESYRAEGQIEKLAEIIVAYRQATGSFSQKEYREVIYPTIKDGLEQIMSALEGIFDGLVIFIDELSQFLQKKKARGEEAETLETLQALGQRIKKEPIWVLAAVQKNPAEIIDENLYVTREEEKVFDRFEQIILTDADIKEIIDRRIIIKDENNRKSIGYIYNDLKKKIPELENYILRDEFVRLYPFHQEFVNSLIFLSAYGSRQRAAIRECWQIVKDRMNNSKDHLITVDLLFDIFKDTIIYDHFKDYYDLYENVYKEVINRPDFKSDRDLADRLVKAMIINGIKKGRPLNVKDLCHYLMVDFELNLGIPLNIIYDDIYITLEEIFQKSRGKGMEIHNKDSEDRLGEHLWEIDPGSSGVKVDPEIMAEMKQLNENDMAVEVQEAINDNQHFFRDFKSYWNTVERMQQSFLWRNTERFGVTTMKNLSRCNIDNFPQIDPANDDVDFALIIEFPFFGGISEKIKLAQKMSQENLRYFYWIPEKLEDNAYRRLKRLKAIKNLLVKYRGADDEEANEKITQLKIEYDDLKTDVKKDIEKAYLSGVIVHNKYTEKDLNQFNNLKSLLEFMINYALDELYYKHPRFGKKCTRAQTNKLIKDFIIPRISKEYTNEIENIAEPFCLVEQGKNGYELVLNGEIFNEINKIIADGEWHGLDQVYQKLRVEPWGIQETGLEIIISALISSGECRAKTRHGEVLTSSNFTRSFIGSGAKSLANQIANISKGYLVSNVVWNEIEQIMDILHIEYSRKRDNINQQNVWSRLISEFLDLKNRVKNAHDYLVELGAELGQFDEFVNELNIKKFGNFLDGVEELKHEDSYEGLNRLRSFVLDYYNQLSLFKMDYQHIKGILSLAENRIDVQLKEGYQYFKKVQLKTAEINKIIDKYQHLYEIINQPQQVQVFLKEIKNAKKAYINKYINLHRNYFHEYQHYFEEIFNLKEYRCLSLLQKVEKIRVYPDLKKRMQDIKDNFRPLCTLKLEEKYLFKKPICSCGFTGVEKFIPLDINKVRENLREGIKEYIKKIGDKVYKEQIDIYLQKEPKSNLKELKKLEVYEIDRMINLVNEKLILELNKALSGTYPVEISIRKIHNIFKGSVSFNKIDQLGLRINNYLKEKVREAIKNKEGITPERVTVIFIDDEQSKFSSYGLDLSDEEKCLLLILEQNNKLSEEEIMNELKRHGYNNVLVRGLISNLNRKFYDKHETNLINIIQGDVIYFYLNKELNEEGKAYE